MLLVRLHVIVFTPLSVDKIYILIMVPLQHLPTVSFQYQYFLGPRTNFIHNINESPLWSNAMYHFYADDTVTYCCSYLLPIAQSLECLQTAFNIVQSHLQALKLVLNAGKTKLTMFSHKLEIPQTNLVS